MAGCTFPLQLGADTAARPISISQVVIAGWTARDAAEVENHIRELEALGVKRPATVPIYYRVSVARLTLADAIEVAGTSSSGEAEVLLLQSHGQLWVGLGSDHTDREVEAYGITVSKQMCDKPFAPQFWPFSEIIPHWDELHLHSSLLENHEDISYQDGSLIKFRQPLDLITRLTGISTLPEGMLMFCGTLPVIGGVRATPEFSFELRDPVLNRCIRHRYRTVSLPIAG